MYVPDLPTYYIPRYLYVLVRTYLPYVHSTYLHIGYMCIVQQQAAEAPYISSSSEAYVHLYLQYKLVPRYIPTSYMCS